VGLEVCLWWMAGFSPLSSKQDILNALYIRGFALSFLFVPINSTILGQMKGPSLGQTAGMLNLFRQLGGSMGIAFGATLLTSKSHENYNVMAAKLSLLNINVQNFVSQTSSNMTHQMSSVLGMATSQQAAAKVLSFRIQNQVFMLSFLELIQIMMLVIGLAILPIIFMKIKRGPTKIVDSH